MLTDMTRELLERLLEYEIEQIEDYYPEGARREVQLAVVHQARAELDAQPQPPQPNWDDAPEWAMWWAVDSDGGVYYVDLEPQIASDTDSWIARHGANYHESDWIEIPIGIDWRALKQRRPEAT